MYALQQPQVHHLEKVISGISGTSKTSAGRKQNLLRVLGYIKDRGITIIDGGYTKTGLQTALPMLSLAIQLDEPAMLLKWLGIAATHSPREIRHLLP